MSSLPKVAAILAFATLVVLAQSYRAAQFETIPLPVICGSLAFFVQWLAFIPAWLLKTEKFYDLTGSATYIAVVFLALALSEEKSLRAVLLTMMVALWAARLGLFLFSRILIDDGDSRFDKIKQSAPRFFLTWTIQGLWVVVTAAAAVAAISSSSSKPLGTIDYLALIIWGAGLLIETIADYQKRQFRRRHGESAFIDSGLWRYSRHPNYFGEILLWSGIALLAAPVLAGWQLISLVSPLFVFFLLTRLSGIPLLEAKAQSKWGENENYMAYLRETSRLVPMPKKKSG